MCKLGDVIVIDKFKNENGETVSKHSFVVINDEQDFVEGFKYDFISNMLCSFHNEEHKKKKLQYKQNLEIKEEKILGEKINDKEGYIKANQLYFFDKSKIEYKVIAHLDSELLDELVQLILELQKSNLLIPIYTNINEEVIN